VDLASVGVLSGLTSRRKFQSCETRQQEPGDVMVTRDLHDSLASHKFFTDLSSDHIDFLVSCAKNVIVEPGDFVFKEGSTAESLYLVRDGNLAIEVSAPGPGELVLATIGAGEMLGWSWLLPPHTHKTDCRAIEQTRLLALDAKCLRDKLAEDHALGYQVLGHVVETLARRLSSTRLQLLDLYSNNGHD